jgi:SagB-type dehydrogenase family enzyme
VSIKEGYPMYRSTTGREFMEKTKYKHLPESDQYQGLPQPPLVKTWPAGGQIIDLPNPASVPTKQIDLTTAINERRSVRAYAQTPITLGELSYLLWTTQGIRETTERPATLRTVPSAGSRHPFETYVLATRVEGLEPGIYAYIAAEHKLQVHQLGADLGPRTAELAFRQQMVARGAATLIWAADAYRSVWRYADRAYRYFHLDAGHVCAHLYLAVQAVGCGCCGIAAFDDDGLNSLLGLDGVDEFVVYLGTVGKLPS